MKSFCHKIILSKFGSLCLVVMLEFSAQALDTLSLLPDGPSKQLLEKKKPIYAETTGEVSVDYTNALVVFERPSLLKDVQDAYGRFIAKDHKPEFTIKRLSAKTNAYYYVNKKGERTDITEVLRKRTSEKTFDIVYYSTGKRFFGHYQAVIHVRIRCNDEKSCRYVAAVYAYPENSFCRFFARHLGLVEHFFHSKTDEMTGIITTITCSLCEKKSEQPQKSGGEKEPLLSGI